VDKEGIVVEDVLTSLAIRDSVREVHVERTDSPWNEKILVKRREGDHLDAKICVWEDNRYLYGRIYRLLLYLYDILNPAFLYDSRRAPTREEAPVWELYAQIWGIYVDSRLERTRIPNFYDRTLRRNLFAEVKRELAWDHASRLFDVLWAKESWTHAEMVEYACAPATAAPGVDSSVNALEVEVRASLKEHSVKKHLERLTSAVLKDMANEILSFTSHHCQGALIRSSYYGIHFDYKATTFAEMIPTRNNTLLLTLRDFRTSAPQTLEISEQTDLAGVQAAIKDLFTLTYLDSQSS
jgi:hypothetical protein